MLGRSWNYLSSSLKFVSLALLRSRAIVYMQKSSLVVLDRNKCSRPSLGMLQQLGQQLKPLKSQHQPTTTPSHLPAVSSCVRSIIKQHPRRQINIPIASIERRDRLLPREANTNQLIDRLLGMHTALLLLGRRARRRRRRCSSIPLPSPSPVRHRRFRARRPTTTTASPKQLPLPPKSARLRRGSRRPRRLNSPTLRPNLSTIRPRNSRFTLQRILQDTSEYRPPPKKRPHSHPQKPASPP